MEERLFPKQRLARLLAPGLALLMLVFAAGVAAHVHANGPGDTSCVICHVAHFGPVALLAPSGVAVAVVVGRIFPRATLLTAQKPFASDHGSRAPPA